MDDDDSEEEYYFPYMLPEGGVDNTSAARGKQGGSIKGRRANKDRDREIWGERLMSDYFGDNPVYDEGDYVCVVTFFELITIALVEDEDCSYFVQRIDATGRPGFLPEQKVTCALRMLAYGASADQLDELIRMAESTVLETLKLFCSNIIRLFGPDLDCMHWTWKNCPTAWQGAFQGKEKCSTVILEAVASKSLWIWHAFDDMPGANNDLNVLERSPLLNDLVNDVAPKISFTVNGATYNQGYYHSDGIYPAWAIFQSSISAPQGNKRKCYAVQQEAARKDVERTFEVLQQRFRILALPCKLWSVDAMKDVMLACIILHNMIVEDEQRIPSLNHQYLFEDEWVSPAEVGVPDECPVAMIANAMQVLEDEELHYELKTDLVEHVWQCYGDLG
ncbi:hypothetical protein PPTG_09158 [Phytophthora nicotianae INRA-310]|uniref:DDE Tnp4 domain-containing protein n=1 Tax=Phytophthora nicotianae (strain INRA-310) TaxID=761204 RepID=W2QGL8_PHYN3|nr:hypothetical protein PPTG_09158 [Phytophthora nicotianae INRA-310]ETN12292.1 hypothetical protein PPTG_09158 [Phytophthora nicotianae INRA-310]